MIENEALLDVPDAVIEEEPLYCKAVSFKNESARLRAVGVSLER